MENNDTGGAYFDRSVPEWSGKSKPWLQPILCKPYISFMGRNLWESNGSVSLFGGGMDAIPCGRPCGYIDFVWHCRFDSQEEASGYMEKGF